MHRSQAGTSPLASPHLLLEGQGGGVNLAHLRGSVSAQGDGQKGNLKAALAFGCLSCQSLSLDTAARSLEGMYLGVQLLLQRSKLLGHLRHAMQESVPSR